MQISGPITSNGADGVAYVSTKFATKDWPDIEMHMVVEDVNPIGSEYFTKIVKVTDKVSQNL